MIISNSFNRFYRATIIEDIKTNSKNAIVLNHSFFGYRKIKLSALSRTSIDKILRQLTLFPKNKDGVAISLTEVSNKEMIKHIVLIKRIMNQNKFYFSSDEEEWNKLINEIEG